MPSKNPKTVLLICDNHQDTNIIRNAFERYSNHYQTHFIHFNVDVKKCFKNLQPDIAIVDWHFAESRGIFGWKEISTQNNFPVIYLTGQDDEKSALEILKSGAFDFITKSIDTLMDLPQSIEKFLLEWELNQELYDTHTRLSNVLQIENRVNLKKDIIYRLDRHGNIVFITNAIMKYGYMPERLLGTHIYELIHPDDREKVKYKVNERRSGFRRNKSFECRIQPIEQMNQDQWSDDSGDVICYIAAAGLYKSSFPTSDGFLGTQGIIRDVSHLKKHALELVLS